RFSLKLRLTSGSKGSDWRYADTISDSTSLVVRNKSIMSARNGNSPLRMSSNTFSSTCVVSASSSKVPKVAAPPLIECAALKIALRSSASGASTSSANNKPSISVKSSSASSKKVSKNWLKSKPELIWPPKNRLSYSIALSLGIHLLFCLATQRNNTDTSINGSLGIFFNQLNCRSQTRDLLYLVFC